MALMKAIKQDNGIILNYHRISEINSVINDKTYLNIISYVDREQREKEINQPKYSPNKPDIYKIFSRETLEYNDELTITEAYDYLKTLEKYKDSEDI